MLQWRPQVEDHKRYLSLRVSAKVDDVLVREIQHKFNIFQIPGMVESLE